MSYNVPEAVMRLAKVKLEYDLRRLPVRQHNALNKYLRTGVIDDCGTVSNLAKQVLEEHGLAWIQKIKRTSGIAWGNVPVDPMHPLREAILVAYAASCLDGTYKRYNLEPQSKENCPLFYFNAAAFKNSFNKISMGYEIVLGETVTVTVTK